jgi:hypothetical protein
MAIVAEFQSSDGKCNNVESDEPIDFPPTVDVLVDHNNEEHLATWAFVLDVGQGFFAAELPTPTANINPVTGAATGGIGAYGLIPGPPLDTETLDPDNNGCFNPFDQFPCVLSPSKGSSHVIARFDVNPSVDSHTDIFVWLQRNSTIVAGDPGSGVTRTGSLTAFLDCEDEFRVSTTLSLPDELNIIDPDTLPGINQCKSLAQYRGNLLFAMPDTGFVWSQITQEGAHFRENYLGYNLGDNDFIDCADGFNDFFNDPDTSAPDLCFGTFSAGTKPPSH